MLLGPFYVYRNVDSTFLHLCMLKPRCFMMSLGGNNSLTQADLGDFAPKGLCDM
jgi:hypothetical protein